MEPWSVFPAGRINRKEEMDVSDPFAEFFRAPSMDLDEYLQVDKFFDNYVSHLESSGPGPYLSSHSGSAGLQGSGGVSQSYVPPSQPVQYVPGAPLAGVPVTSQYSEPYQRAGVNPAAPMSPEVLSPTTDPQSQPCFPSVKHDFSPPPQNQPGFQMFSGQAVGQPGHADVKPMDYVTTSAFATSSGSADPALGVGPNGHVVTSTETKGGARGGNKSGMGRTRNRTVRQQTLNKQAQQRYRQRKKAKAIELEMAVESLSDEIQHLKAVKEEKKMLEERTMELERNLLEKDAEIQRLKTHNSAKKGSEKDSNCSDMSSTDLEKDVDRAPSRLAMEFETKVQSLERVLQRYSLDPSQRSDPSTRDINEHAMKDVSKAVEEVCMTCVRILRVDGPNVWDLIQGRVGGGVIYELHGHDRWMEIAASLQLSEEQRRLAEMLRSQHLEKCDKISNERQSLNLQAISLLLPNDQGGQAPALGKSCFSISSFIQKSKHSSRTHMALDKLKTNLREEQKLISELEYMTFNRVMNPIQGAWAILGAKPLHCDCLTLLNAICELKPAGGDSSKSIVGSTSHGPSNEPKY